MSLDKHLEPDWVDDYDLESADDIDPDLDRDRREAEAIEDEYDAWVDRQMGACRREAS